MKTERLLTKKLTATMLGISIRTLEYRTSAGDVPGFCMLFDKLPRWRESEISKWIEDGCPAKPRKSTQEHADEDSAVDGSPKAYIVAADFSNSPERK